MEVEFNVFEELSRHYWITLGTPGVYNPDEPISEHVLRGALDRRGVKCIDIPSWKSKEFQDWWKALFLP